MHPIEWTRRALGDIDRLDAFLRSKNPTAAEAAIDIILGAVVELATFPEIGRPLSKRKERYRELLVPFSNSGYVILYRFDEQVVEIQAIKHMREDQY